ncbi:MAG: transporter [Nevskia sp.]|nr:transporter [Nevskia sp.]
MKDARWRVLALYGAWNGLMQFEWLRFAPITDTVAAQYHMSASEVGQLSLVFPLLFLPLALPSGWLIDRRSARFSLNLSAVLMTLGVALRALAPNAAALLAGQTVLAIAQPLVMALISKLVGVWFAEDERLQATGLGTLSIFVGLGLAFLLVPPTAAGDVHESLWVDVFALAALLLATLLGVPKDSSLHAGTASSSPTLSWFAGLRTLLKSRLFAAILLLIFFANGYSNAIFTWLEPMLLPQGINATQAGIAGLLILAGGILGMSLLPRMRDIEQGLRPLMLLVTGIGIPLTIVLLTSSHFIWVMLASFLIGALLLSPLPIFVDVVARLGGAALAGTAVSSFWLVGNAGAAAAIGVMSWVADQQRWPLALWILLGLLAVNFVIAGLLLRASKA